MKGRKGQEVVRKSNKGQERTGSGKKGQERAGKECKGVGKGRENLILFFVLSTMRLPAGPWGTCLRTSTVA